MSFHRTIILGNLGKDPEMRYAASGDAICNFSVAVTEKYKDKEKTSWYRVTAFGKQAELAGEYLQKGSQVLVEGRMQEDKYTDKEGAEKTSWGLRCDNLRFVGKATGEQKPKAAASSPQPAPENFDDDDLPFN